MSKPNFRPIAPLDVDDTALERVNERLGVPTMVRQPAQPPQSAAMTASRQPVAPPRRQQKLTVRIPGYAVDALKRDALNARTTVRHLVLVKRHPELPPLRQRELPPPSGFMIVVAGLWRAA